MSHLATRLATRRNDLLSRSRLCSFLVFPVTCSRLNRVVIDEATSNDWNLTMDAGLIDSELVAHKDRTHWLNGRACSIGSSDAAVILGYGYSGSSKYALWAEKCHGIKEPIPDSTLKMFEKGHAAEPYIAKLCEIDKGWSVQFDPRYSYRRNRKLPYLTCSLDAWMIERSEHVALEFKNISSWVAQSEWDVRSGKAPLKYTIQLQHQLAVTGWKKGYLVALVGFDIYVVEVKRHDDLIAAMLAEYESFWSHVTNKTEPKIDASEATYSALSKVHVPKPMNPKHLCDEGSAMIDLIANCEEVIETQTECRDRTLNELISVAGDADYLVTSDGQWYSFKSVRGKRKLKPHKGKLKV